MYLFYIHTYFYLFYRFVSLRFRLFRVFFFFWFLVCLIVQERVLQGALRRGGGRRGKQAKKGRRKGKGQGQWQGQGEHKQQGVRSCEFLSVFFAVLGERAYERRPFQNGSNWLLVRL